MKVPRVLTIAGSDPSGGAGIEADLKTITAHRCHGLTCIDSLTVQNTLGVKQKYNTPGELLRKILAADFADRVDAVKIGMLTAEAAAVLPEFLKGTLLVVDTLLSSTSGFDLTTEQTMMDSIGHIYAKATLITPNYVEAAKLCSAVAPSVAELPVSLESMKTMAKTLRDAIGCKAVLVKGGHVPWGDSEQFLTDVLYESAPVQRYTVFKHNVVKNTDSTHGTGCTLASAVASNLALGHGLRDSVSMAIRYTHFGILYADRTIGHGKGPLNHTYAISGL